MIIELGQSTSIEDRAPILFATEPQEQQRLKRQLARLERESKRLIDAYQSGIIELDDLKERRERVAEECRRLEERLSSLEQQRQGQQRQAALATTVEEFCRNISAALDNPSVVFQIKCRNISFLRFCREVGDIETSAFLIAGSARITFI